MQYVLYASPLSLKFNGPEQITHLFRWDNRFTAFIINSPVYYLSNSAHPDLKDTYLNYLCTSTNGQVIEVSPASVLQLSIRQFLVPSSDFEFLARSQLAPLYPSIKIQLNPSFAQQQRIDFLSIVVPLADASLDPAASHSQLLEQFYASPPESPLFYGYPEPRDKQSVFPVFQLRGVAFSERESMRKSLEESKLPFDSITVDPNQVIEATSRVVKLLMLAVKEMKEMKEVPFLFGEDEHMYGMIQLVDPNSLQMLFFPPDFPLLLNLIRSNQFEKIVAWIQTIPVQYVPPIYAFLTRKNVKLPFPCPTLPPRKKIADKFHN